VVVKVVKVLKVLKGKHLDDEIEEMRGTRSHRSAFSPRD